MLSINSTVGVAGILALAYIGGAAAEEPATSSATIAGVVFDDLNGNAVRDDKEPGIAGIRVSDQVSVASTGDDGSFLLQGDGGYGIVYVSQPAGYRVGGPFWRGIPVNGEAVEFPLTRTEQPVDFTFIHASDPHLSVETLDRMRRLREIVAEQQPAFVLITGDLIKDALRVGEEEATGLYELLCKSWRSFRCPCGTPSAITRSSASSAITRWSALSIRSTASRCTATTWGRTTTPSTSAAFVSSASIPSTTTISGTTGMSTRFRWPGCRKNSPAWRPRHPVVTFNHIPLLSAGEIVYGFHEGGPAPSLITVDGETRYRHTVGNAREVLSELRQHRFDLALSGHFHMREELFFESRGVKTRFHMAPAVRDDSSTGSGLDMISGVTLYRVAKGEIDDGTFIPLDSVP